MKYLLILLVLASGCGTSMVRSNSPELRVMVDPDSVSRNSLHELEAELMDSGRFYVVTRGAGFAAAQREQERLHRDEPTRYEDAQKWAHWGKLYGVGGIIVAHQECQEKDGFVSRFLRCRQALSLIDANTGLVIAAIYQTVDGKGNEINLTPSWNETVEKFVSRIPSRYSPVVVEGRAARHAEESAEKAKAMRKIASQIEEEAERSGLMDE